PSRPATLVLAAGEPPLAATAVHYDVFIDPAKDGLATATASVGELDGSRVVPVLSGATATLGSGPVYQIEVFQPPLTSAPTADVAIHVPSGWRVATSPTTSEPGGGVRRVP